MGKDNKIMDIGWVLVPPEILSAKDINMAQKVIWGRINGLKNKEGYCYASNEWLGWQLGMSGRTVERHISVLVEKGYVERRYGPKGKADRRLYPIPQNSGKHPAEQREGIPQNSGKHLLSNRVSSIREENIMSDSSDPAAEVLNYLNEKAQTHYRLSKTSLRPIHGRMKDGASIDDMRLVVDFKVAEWFADEKMRQYLRPKTLFGPENFEGYLAAAKAWAARGKPAVNGNSSGRDDDYIRALKEDIAQIDSYVEYQIDARLAKLSWRKDLSLEEEEEKERLERVRAKKLEERERLMRKLKEVNK